MKIYGTVLGDTHFGNPNRSAKSGSVGGETTKTGTGKGGTPKRDRKMITKGSVLGVALFWTGQKGGPQNQKTKGVAHVSWLSKIAALSKIAQEETQR